MNKKAPTIAFLGDSVTQGCFEVYKKDGKIIQIQRVCVFVVTVICSNMLFDMKWA